MSVGILFFLVVRSLLFSRCANLGPACLSRNCLLSRIDTGRWDLFFGLVTKITQTTLFIFHFVLQTADPTGPNRFTLFDARGPPQSSTLLRCHLRGTIAAWSPVSRVGNSPTCPSTSPYSLLGGRQSNKRGRKELPPTNLTFKIPCYDGVKNLLQRDPQCHSEWAVQNARHASLRPPLENSLQIHPITRFRISINNSHTTGTATRSCDLDSTPIKLHLHPWNCIGWIIVEQHQTADYPRGSLVTCTLGCSWNRRNYRFIVCRKSSAH